MKNHAQDIFDGVRENFRWVEKETGSYWYKFDEEKARKSALRDRNEVAKEYKANGWNVRRWSLRGQVITRGGIGTPYPGITIVVTAYGFDAWR